MGKNGHICFEISEKELDKKGIAVILPAFNVQLSIGSIVLNARRHTDSVFVIDKGNTDHTSEMAQLAGAEVIYSKGERDALKTGIEIVAQKGAKIIIIISSADLTYPDHIPEFVRLIRNRNYDFIVGSLNGKTFSDAKNILFLENEDYGKESGILAFSTQSIKRINLTHLNGSPIKGIISQAEKSHMKIRYLNFENEPNFNLIRNYDIGVVVPAYNEEMLIEETIKGIPDYVKRIFVIDDGSRDRTPAILKRITDKRMIAVRHEGNKGVGAAIVTGYKLAIEEEMDIIAVMAGDNQMDPRQLPRLLNPIIEGRADYTKGNRLANKNFRKGMSKWRFFGNVVLTLITKIGSGYWHVTDPQNGYTAISRRALKYIDLDSLYPYYGYCNDLLIKLNPYGIRVEDINMPARYGSEKSKIRYLSYIMKVAPMNFKGFLWRLKTKYVVLDFHPLIFFYGAGMILFPAGVILSLYIIIQKWFQVAVSPNFPLLAAFMVLMGIQFLIFAMLFDMQADRSRIRNV